MIGDCSLVAVTGTNGKTSVTSFIAQISRACGKPAAAIGQRIELDKTILNRDVVPRYHGGLLEYFNVLIKSEQCKVIATEIYSAAIARLVHDNIPYDMAVFTNLASDHQSVHGSSVQYRKDKLRFLDTMDEGSYIYIPSTASRLDEILHGVNKAKLKPVIVQSENLSAPFTDNFMNENALLASEICLALGMPEKSVSEAIKNLIKPPGRMLRKACKNGALVIIDFAHNAHGLRAALLSLRKETSGQIYLILSSKGGWGREKRRALGCVALECSDHVIVTDDDPRHEDPALIRQHLIVSKKFDVISNRAHAILKALSQLNEHDTLLVAGRGEDDYFVNSFGRVKFNDAHVVDELIIKHRF